ncbi:F-box/kelch-repeat protein At3g06240-like [Euphorbia lathyris]|uniref:F-box/kelch-repeat protein At3g06240-like n=1 Tax=Euphorbia lathyris TaxID=212925 RepID=UPI003313D519
MAGVPQEVTEDILSRLPAKSILRFKSASKTWYSLISENHTFAKFHLKQSSESKNLIFYQCPAYGDIFKSSDVYTYESRIIKFPVEIDTPCRLIGSANGLICVASCKTEDCCFIWNPCTDECKRISVPFPSAGCRLFGFGHDSILDDYKIIGAWDSHLGIFSLKTNSWKTLEYSCGMTAFKYASAVTAVHSDGALYWYVGAQITAFDLAREKILVLDLPEEINDFGYYNSSWVPLFDYQGLLCVSWRKSIWVMKEYGNSNSWAKLTTSLPYEYAKPVGISRLGEVIFCTVDGFVKSDLQGRMHGDDKSRMRRYVDAFMYKESLISPKCFDPKG